LRRLIQVFALLAMVLTGSWPGVSLAATSKPMPCCADLPAGQCPRQRPASGPPTPCCPTDTGRTPQTQVLATAVQAVAPATQAQAQRREPSPAPAFALAAEDARLVPEQLLARAQPGRAPPFARALERQARLSVFRI